MSAPAIMTGRDFTETLEALGLTRKEAAEALGLSLAQIDNLRAGVYPVRKVHALALLALAARKTTPTPAEIARGLAALLRRRGK